MSLTLNAWVIDDERLAREKLKEMLAESGLVKVVGEADGVSAAKKLLKGSIPDVVFLDIQMPGQSGFQLLEYLPSEVAVVFVTAYDAYALRAFEVNALDYLLKPVRSQRLRETLQRLGARQQPEPVIKQLEYDDHLFVKGTGSYRFLRVDKLTCLVADGPYSVVWEVEGTHTMVPRSLKQWVEMLPLKHFLRIHRSAVVNLDHVRHVERNGANYHLWVTAREQPLTMSRRFAAEIRHRSI